MPLPQPRGEAHIQATHAQRGQRQRHAIVVQQAGLQRERGDRHAEHDGAIHVALEVRRLTQREQHGDEHIEEEEQDQERLGGRELRAVVLQYAPHRADQEGGDEAEQRQRSPCAEPRDADEAGVQDGVVREQRHVIALAGGDEQWRRKTTGCREHRERHRVLQHGERHGERGDEHQQRERRHRWQQRVKAHRREHGQIENRDGAALHRERVARPLDAQAPAEHQHHDRGERHARQAELHRQRGALGDVSQQERDAEEQHDDARAHQRVAAGEVIAHQAHEQEFAWRPGRSDRWLRLELRVGRGRRRRSFANGFRLGLGLPRRRAPARGRGRSSGSRRGLDRRRSAAQSLEILFQIIHALAQREQLREPETRDHTESDAEQLFAAVTEHAPDKRAHEGQQPFHGAHYANMRALPPCKTCALHTPGGRPKCARKRRVNSDRSANPVSVAICSTDAESSRSRCAASDRRRFSR